MDRGGGPPSSTPATMVREDARWGPLIRWRNIKIE
jgi:hypothetical protein